MKQIILILLLFFIIPESYSSDKKQAPSAHSAWIKSNSIYAYDRRAETHRILLNVASKSKELKGQSTKLYRIAGQTISQLLKGKWGKGKKVSIRLIELNATNEYGQPDWSKSPELLKIERPINKIIALKNAKPVDIPDRQLIEMFK